MSSLLERLAHHLARPVGESDRSRATVHLTDWMACVAGGRRSPVAEVATAVGEPLASAALLGNVLEMDDVHRAGRLHPGPVIWPAVLSVTKDAAAMLEAAVAGYETMITLGAALDDFHYARWHPTATAGLVGAAAAASRALGLDPERTADALGHAASLAGGLWHMRHSPGMTKQVHVLHAAEQGVRCARLAAAGVTGAHATLEGPQGLFEVMTATAPNLEFGDAWRIAEVSFKPWAACRHAHPAIDAAIDLDDDGGEIRVATYRDALTFCDNADPQTPQQARFSLQHATAVALAHRDARPEHFEMDEVVRLGPVARRVQVSEDPAITAAYPQHFGARVTIGGDVVSRADTLGDPERPLSAEQHRAKLATLCAWGGLPPSAPAAVEQAAAGGPATVRELLTEWLA